MKKSLLFLPVAILALVLVYPVLDAWAASYTITTNAAQEVIITRARTEDNAATCALVSLPANCTQAQFDAAAVSFPGVAGTVYANNQAYLVSLLVADFQQRKAKQDVADITTCQALAKITDPNNLAIFCRSIGASPNCTIPTTCVQ